MSSTRGLTNSTPRVLYLRAYQRVWELRSKDIAYLEEVFSNHIADIVYVSWKGVAGFVFPISLEPRNSSITS